MKKNSGDEIQSIEVDPISGKYHLVIPEWIANELSWYEDTQIVFSIDGKEVVISEYTNDK